MNAKPERHALTLPLGLRSGIQKALSMVSPSWPLDRSIAVNPLWEFRGELYDDVAAKMGALGNINCFMPESYYDERLTEGKISDEAILLAAVQYGLPMNPTQMKEWMKRELPRPDSYQTLSRLIDRKREAGLLPWHEEIIFQVSQAAASYYQGLEQSPKRNPKSFYRSWLQAIRMDLGLSIRMREPRLKRIFQALPDDKDELIRLALMELDVSLDLVESYSLTLILDLLGWASWASYRNFGREKDWQDPAGITELFTVRLAWDYVIWKLYSGDKELKIRESWHRQKMNLPSLNSQWKTYQLPFLTLARAEELSYQADLAQKLRSVKPERAPDAKIQALFCIDVRSELIRRALEAEGQDVQTLGVAGFFGLPIAFKPSSSSYVRPQLPGLIEPKLTVEPKTHAKEESLARRSAWMSWSKNMNASFFMVESLGLSYLWRIVKRSFGSGSESHPINSLGHHRHWHLMANGVGLEGIAKVELAHGILQTMSVQKFAPKVLLVGHASETSNNPQAAALDCGACGGQSGEVNVRVLAELLNEGDVRTGLRERGIHIPTETKFLAAIHNTTTNTLILLDEGEGELKARLERASLWARRERRLQLGYSSKSDAENRLQLQKKAEDWSEVRPEWGLAGNASFLIGPREYSRSIDLQGRSFLHDYNEALDPGHEVLERLLTAPMIVTHWINMQYNCSMTDNKKWGSGNKVLHNVVGGNLGIFEGNGGDLRTGLSLQSLSDGKRWMHIPQRLSVYVAADAEAIARLLRKHAMLQDLVRNEWISIFHWTPNFIKPLGKDSLVSKES